MVAKRSISCNLSQINRLFNTSKNQKMTLYYSKLAILELCGWIEESMDEIVLNHANHHLKNTPNRTWVKDKVVNRTSGFEYDRYFRQMLISILGIIKVEKLEGKLDSVKFTLLKSSLVTLTKCRNDEAHTHIKGVTKTIDAPSVTQTRFTAVFEGLKNLESCMRRFRY